MRPLFHGSILGAVIAAATLSGLMPAHAGITDKDNDFNNDGASDLLAIKTTTPTGTLYRWNGDGSGSIMTGDPVSSSWDIPHWGFTNQLAAPGDLNSDGDADIVAIDYINGCLDRWLGDGSGEFADGTGGTQLGCGWSTYIDSITGAGDLDGDGDGDLVAVNASGCLIRWRGNGVGGFATGTQIGCGWSPYRYSLAAPGDLNGDSDADLVAVNSSTGCLFGWEGDGGGGFGNGTQLSCGWAPYQGQLAGMGDLNGDGDGDLIGINRNTNCAFRWLGNGTGGFSTGAQLGCTGWSDKYLAR